MRDRIKYFLIGKVKVDKNLFKFIATYIKGNKKYYFESKETYEKPTKINLLEFKAKLLSLVDQQSLDKIPKINYVICQTLK